MRVLALTGTPGTGKTTVARGLADEVTVVDANDLAERVDAVDDHDEARDAALVDEHRLEQRARQALPDEGRVLVEGLLAHRCDPDAVVLLRCHPDELGARLADRNWPQAKVEENVMAETLDALVPEIEAPARELDTTDRSPADVHAIVDSVLAEGSLDRPELDPLGTADWTDTLAAEGAP